MDELASLNVGYLKGRKVCATGRLITMTHGELEKLVTACGGTYIRMPTRSKILVVVGQGGWPSDRNGTVNQVYDRARRLRAYGYPIAFTGEDQFLEKLGLAQSAGAIRGTHTLHDLSRILKIPAVRLRRWFRAGLIEPTEVRFQIPFFDFRRVAYVKQLQDWIEAGVPLADIRRGIGQWKDSLPTGETIESLWASMERDGRMLVRLRDRLVDQTGQRYFDFDADDSPTTYFPKGLESGLDDLCDQALALEEQGLWQEAADAYARAIQLNSGHATLHFDLGNVQFQLGQFSESIASFRRALEIDPQFAMAWHNLGCVYAHLAKWNDAESALRRALELVPTYADSHLTLAEVLENAGRAPEAAGHRSAYSAHSKADCLAAGHGLLLRVFCAGDDS